MKKSILSILSCGIIFLAGCAEITPPNPIEVIKHPLGNDVTLRRGMTKDAVKAAWGDPHVVKNIGPSKFGGDREEWTYYGMMSKIPADINYMSKTVKLYFDGDNLADFKKGEAKEEKPEEAKEEAAK
ncbi:MAG: hypothetical protein HY589_03390 [Candidatus Omnitrophica bacterium]|nr:hypothetical protein [Candidatus Omnitrophota bacterium]